VPEDFAAEVARALDTKQLGKLALLAMEASGFPWETEGLRIVGNAQINAIDLRGAKYTWEMLLKLDENDEEGNLRLGTVYQRLGDLTRSNQCLERVTKLPSATPADLAATRALLGRNRKQLWEGVWVERPAEEQPKLALLSPLLIAAYEEYRAAFGQDLNAHYPGINALGLLIIIVELAKKYPDVWKKRFADKTKAQLELDELQRQRQELSAAVAFCIRANKSGKDDSDFWLNVSEADYHFLTSSDPESVGYAYSRVVPELQAFHKESIRRHLQLFRALGVLTENVQAALEAVPSEAGGDPAGISAVAKKIDHLIVFTGHRIDNKDRQTPRFPAKCETAARDEIRKTVQSIKELSKEKIVGVAGAASGGDILFHEVCRELSISTMIFLCLPTDAYIAASVAPADADWEKRFYEIGAAKADVSVFSESTEIPRWLTGKKGYDIWQRNNLWELSQASALGAEHMTLIALWDGKKGDGPVGTEHMVKIARERNANIRILDTNQIFQKI
jgi:tetratricopeptide (TPR) repeat protein